MSRSFFFLFVLINSLTILDLQVTRIISLQGCHRQYDFPQQNQSMRQTDRTSRKHISQSRKHSISQKTRSDNPSSHSTKQHKEEQTIPNISRGMKSLGRKYAQQNCFKIKEKQHYQIVISDEVVRNSKLYRMLKQKIEVVDSMFERETHEFVQTKQKLAKEITQIRTGNHNRKLALWQLKNQILQLKGILNDEEEESKRLEAELTAQEQYEEQEEEREEMMENGEEEEGREENKLTQEECQLEKQEELSEGNKQEAMEIKLMMVELNSKLRLNPQQQKKQEKEQQASQKQEEK